MRDRVWRWARRLLAVVTVLAAVSAAAGLGAWRWWTRRLDVPIREAAALYGVDPALLREVIRRESRFRVYARGTKGERGLMQVTGPAAEEWAKAEGVPQPMGDGLFDPRVNTRIGAWYLARAIRRWSDRPDPLPYALAEYNAGRSNASRWARDAVSSADFAERISYPSTRRYVLDILRRYRGGLEPPRAAAAGH